MEGSGDGIEFGLFHRGQIGEEVDGGAGFDLAEGGGLPRGFGLVGEDDGVGDFCVALDGEHGLVGGAGDSDLVGADVGDGGTVEEGSGDDVEGIAASG